MYNTTHDVEKIITFDSIRENFKYFEKYHEYNHHKKSTVYRLICILCITTGLEMKLVSKLKWKDLLMLGSENNAIVKDILKIRQYRIPIHPKVKQFLSDSYCGFGFPNLESSFSDSFTVEEYQGETAEWIVRCMSSSSKLSVMKKEYLREFNFESYPQIMFGRKVFEVNGYTNDISKYLKLHFGFHTNKELFQFLGYNSKDDIKCELYSINLSADGNFVTLEDKNFNDNYPFQKFSAFSKFLSSGIYFYPETITNSVRLLLLVSLYNGIKLTKLLKLKWSHIVEINEKIKRVEIRKVNIFDKYHINIDDKFKEIMQVHYNISLKRNHNIDTNSDYVYLNEHYKDEILIDDYVFVTNTGNPITQPSLSREIKKTLNYLKFPHADKMTSNSTVIMYGRRIIEIKGDHKPTIKKLKEHFKFKSKKELFDFLYLISSKEKTSTNFKGKMRKNIFEDILYDY